VNKPTTILGISAFYHDSAAALLRDGEIIAAGSEERFTRKKGDSDFPRRAVDYCLREAGIGLASSGNLNPARTGPSMFEPVHGSAHDSVGSDRVNPSSQILSAVMMLEFLGETDAASRIRKALDDVQSSSPVPTTIGDLVAGRL